MLTDPITCSLSVIIIFTISTAYGNVLQIQYQEIYGLVSGDEMIFSIEFSTINGIMSSMYATLD